MESSFMRRLRHRTRQIKPHETVVQNVSDSSNSFKDASRTWHSPVRGVFPRKYRVFYQLGKCEFVALRMLRKFLRPVRT